MRKLFYLFLALLLPALIFVFLKYQGRNQFDIPVFHEQGVSAAPTDCPVNDEKPYRFTNKPPFDAWQPGKANVLLFPADGLKTMELKNALLDEFGREIRLEEAVNADSAAAPEWKRCVFFVKDPFQTVLFDEEGRIRGYYDLRSLDELDRLRVEVKILLEKY